MRSRVDQLVLARRIIFLVVLLVLAIPYGQIARAEEVIYNFKITATNPTNGENSVPTNLKDGNCQNQYCALMVGLGNSDKSPMGHGYPFLVPDSINTSTIQITGSNNPSQIKVMGESEGGGDDSFYHSNALFLFNSLGNLYYLEPNSTYSVTFKGGTSGVKAQYDYGEYFAYLDQDYTFSFTTGNGPSRTNEDYPTLTARPTLTPSVSLKNDSVEVRLTSTPIPMLIDKKDNIPTTSKLTVTSSASPTISIPAKKEDDITVTSDDFKSSSKITFWQRIKNYWTNFINKLFKKTKKKK
ncbi:hypothetical protein L6273_01330 [Candidatus Parcubacteria bacterium]|nr:hypothetical protein [Candidatus Parcubacteria bacterium]